uniref:Conserved oligomeric Golgi complex subunit 3 n=1 Tax=Triatoma infestans TaxID=30076 RepID=A0A023F072_TRIIF
MSDVSSKEISNNNLIFNWERPVEPLAPLTNSQRNIVLDLCQEIKEIGPFYKLPTVKSEDESTSECIQEIPAKINNSREFLQWYAEKESEWLDREDDHYRKYLKHLANQKEECGGLLAQVEKCLNHLKDLGQEYQKVSNKTNSLHQVSEELLADQMKLINVRDEIKERLNHFKSLDRFTQSLDSSVFNIHSSNLESVFDQLNEHINYHRSHSTFKESYSYLSRYEQCLRRLLSLMRSYIASGLTLASAHASANSASHYAKFQVARYNLQPLIAILEARVSVSPLYESTLTECQETYVNVRHSLIGPSVTKTMESLVPTSASGSTTALDHCSLMRSACAFLVHLSLDEHRLYKQFFSTQTDIFNKYLEALCTSLYDTTRPLVIHMKHLESLAELCSILKLEMIQEQVNNNREALGAFGIVAEQLLEDVQERLVFRAHMYLRSDVAEYKPSPGDLAYPEKLHMMQSIAQSLHEQEVSSLARSDSRSSLTSIGSSQTSQEVSKIINPPPPPTSSPADLHGMWYPPVRRTLLCLSRLYRCVERPTFQGISQEALTLCMESVKHASTLISNSKSPLDGEMFQIKHLLILREQIAPFQVDFTVKEMALDFSKMKNAAFQLLNKRTRLFSLSSNNALLEFLLEGSLEVREQWLDSRKDVDRGLKASCEAFILHATHHLLPNFLPTIEKSEEWKPKETLKEQPWAKPEVLSSLVQIAINSIKSRLPGLQATMQLYLANRDTEFILYRPIKNNVVGCFTRLSQLLSSGGYTVDEQTLVGCPSPEQAYILVSSASLLQPSSRKTSTEVPPTASSAPATSRKTSTEVAQPAATIQASNLETSAEVAEISQPSTSVQPSDLKTSIEISPSAPPLATSDRPSNNKTYTEVFQPKSST